MVSPMITPRYAEDARHLAELSPRELGYALEGCDVAYLRNLAGHLNVATVGVTGRKMSGAVILVGVYKAVVAMKGAM